MSVVLSRPAADLETVPLVSGSVADVDELRQRFGRVAGGYRPDGDLYPTGDAISQAGGSGQMLFDDISLYRPAAAPTDPSLLGSWMFDEGAGATAADSSGSGLDGAISGATWASPGADGTGSCLDFDGVETTLVDLGNFDVNSDTSIDSADVVANVLAGR